MEAACLVMEAFHQFDNKIKVPVFFLISAISILYAFFDVSALSKR